jgi:hypothetical protein
LPDFFHGSGAFKKTLSIIKKSLADPSVLDDGRVDAPLLLLGLTYREVSRAVEMEPGAPTDAPDHLKNSPFGIQEMNKIETLIDGVVLPD